MRIKNRNRNNILETEQFLFFMINKETNINSINNRIRLVDYIIINNHNDLLNERYDKIIIELHVKRFKKK